jgi:hypothetical protein
VEYVRPKTHNQTRQNWKCSSSKVSVYLQRRNNRLTHAKPMSLTVKHTFYAEVQSSYMGEDDRLTILDSKPQFRSDASSMLNATSEGSIVLTTALGLALTIVQPQSIRRRLNSYNFDAGLDYGKTTGSKHQKPSQLFEQKFYGFFEHMSLAFESTSLQRQRSFHAQSIRRLLDSYNFGATDFDYTTGLTMEKLQVKSIKIEHNCLDKSFLPRRDKPTTLKLLVYRLYTRGL